MKKIFALIAVAVLSIMNANAQLNIKKSDSTLKEIKTISPYWIWLYQDSQGYYLVVKSSNQYDEMNFWLPIGKNANECIESINGLISVANDAKSTSYYVEDTFGGKLHLFGMKGLGEKIISINDTGHRYAGNGQISTIHLNKAKKWISENLRGGVAFTQSSVAPVSEENTDNVDKALAVIDKYLNESLNALNNAKDADTAKEAIIKIRAYDTIKKELAKI